MLSQLLHAIRHPVDTLDSHQITWGSQYFVELSIFVNLAVFEVEKLAKYGRLARAWAVKARANKLSPEKRSADARNAALARHSKDSSIPQAEFDGDLNIAGAPIKAANLPDGRRVLTQGTFLQAIGRSRSPKAGTGALTMGVDGLPFFLQAEQLKPFLTQELLASTTPVVFRLKSGQKAVGYDALLLPAVCEVYLKLRDAYSAQQKPVPNQYQHIVEACDMLIRGFARVGILALVDEATGFQEIRDRKALAEILKQYIDGALYAWTETFPIQWYKEIFRLNGWTWNNGKMPGVVGTWTNDLVYDRIAKGMLEELKRINPKDEKGRRKHYNYKFFTPEVGYPALNQRLFELLGMARASSSWDQYYDLVDRTFPKVGQTMALQLS